MNKPNLFSFATSELSQDAFISWLLSWADPRHALADSALNKTATLLLDRLLALGQVDRPAAYDKVLVERQRYRIDVLVTVNDEIAIIIEDKTFTQQHSGQLERYREEVRKHVPGAKIAAIYFKTGDQSRYDEILNAGYSCFRRADFLQLLDQGSQLGVTSDTYLDFLGHLNGLEEAVKSFRRKPLDEWDSNCWAGFFMELQKQLRDGDWAYVPNASHGFMGFWWYRRDPMYLQLEEGRLCFKVWVEEKAQQASQWDECHNAVMEAAQSTEMVVKRPYRRRTGTSMTVAIIEGYRCHDEKGILDLVGTVDFLKEKAQKLLDEAAGTGSGGPATTNAPSS